MISEETRKKWKQKIETIIGANESGYGVLELTEWEASFIDSIEQQICSGKDLSFKQSSILNKIYDRIS
jgi:hypothetical protein